MTRDQLIAAHDAAEDFHAAMWRALTCQQDIEDLEAKVREKPTNHEARNDLAVARANYRLALGDSAQALKRMPPEWAEVLSVQVKVAA